MWIIDSPDFMGHNTHRLAIYYIIFTDTTFYNDKYVKGEMLPFKLEVINFLVIFHYFPYNFLTLTHFITQHKNATISAS